MVRKWRNQFYNFRKFGKLPEYWAYFLADNFNSSHKTRFVIFSQGRTGSSLLVNLLHQNPEIYCDNELVQKYLLNPVKYLEGRALMTFKQVYGVNIQPYQMVKFLGQENSKVLIHALYKNGWKVIYLKRKDIFRHSLSNEIAKKRGYFFKDKAEFDSKGKVYIETEAFRKAIQARFKFWRDEQATLDGLDYFEVIYEDNLFTDLQKLATIRKLYRSLDVEPAFTPAIPFVRSTTDDLKEIVSNYNELQEIWHQEVNKSTAD